MASSYFVTFGDNRLTFPGATGSVAWEYKENIPVTRYEYKLWTTPDGSGKSSGTLPSALSAFDEFIVAYGLHKPQYTRLYNTFDGTANNVGVFTVMSDGGTGRYGYYMSMSTFSSNATQWKIVNNTGTCYWWSDTKANANGALTARSYPNRINSVYEVIGVKYQ